MPTTLIGPLWSERRYGTSVNGDGLEIPTITLPFLVRNKTFTGGVLEALTADGLPTYGDTYAAVLGGVASEGDAGLLVKGRTAAQHDNHPQYWRVEVEYSAEAFDPARQERNPLWLPPDLKWGKEREREGLEVDLDGAPIVNAAGVPYQTVEVDGGYRVISVTRNLPDFNRRFWDDFEDLVNDDVFQVEHPGEVFEAYRCKVHEISTAGRKFANNTTYWPTTLTVHIKEVTEKRPRPWDLYLLNAGLEYWDDVAETLKPFTDRTTGRPASTPQLLASDGGYLVSPNGGPLTGGLEPNYRHFRRYDSGSYNDLAALFING